MHVAEAESAPGIFGDADFHSRPFRGSERREYFADARRRFRGRDLVFLDPDKGLRPRRGLEDAHLDWDDAAEMFGAGHSLAVTQFPRWGAPEGNLAAVAEKRDALAKRLRAEVRVVHFCRHPWLFFLVAVQPRHAAATRAAPSPASADNGASREDGRKFTRRIAWGKRCGRCWRRGDGRRGTV